MKGILKKKIDNYYLIEKQKEARAVVLDGYPCWLTVDPANYCNLQCPLCPTGQGRGSRPKKALPFAVFKRVMDELGPYLIHADFCNWGEPLLNEDLCGMIEYAKRFRIHTKLDTNMNVFDEKKAEEIISSGLDKIILSIDGATQESYQKYRVKGDLEKVIRNIKILVERRKRMNRANPRIEWQFLVFRHNEVEMQDARKMAADLGVDEINFTPPYTGSIEWLTTLEPFRSKYYEINGEKVEFRKPGEKTVCNWLWDGITVNSSGSVSPCCSVEDAKDDFCGNISEDAFDKIWNGKMYAEARKHVANHAEKPEKESRNVCLRCDHVGWSNHMDIEFILRKMEKEVNGAD
ncbi:MAG: radical SAM protein [Elusimicrobia bacterium]|nr:radical SAM protein [Elusimicrobiota bacterium]